MTDPITSTEAAHALNVSIATIARLARRGDLIAEKKSLRRNSPLLISAASVEVFRARRQVGPQAQQAQ